MNNKISIFKDLVGHSQHQQSCHIINITRLRYLISSHLSIWWIVETYGEIMAATEGVQPLRLNSCK